MRHFLYIREGIGMLIKVLKLKMSNSNRRREKKTDEVEQLLQVAQDELLLKMSVDSHMSRVAPDYLLPDLNRRFQALKSRPSNQYAKPTTAVKEDDLLARFAALKATSSSNNNSSIISHLPDTLGDDDDDEEDEVAKIISWAKDAARLDPSPPSDDDDDLNIHHDHDYRTDEDDYRSHSLDKREKGHSPSN